jgi:hypothetical protein
MILDLAGVESEQAWLDAIHSLVARNPVAPVLAVIDGSPSRATALKAQWPKLAIQRCTNHELWNLLAEGPGPSARGIGGGLSAYDLRRKPDRGGTGAGRLRTQVAVQLQRAVSSSFEEAGDELFTLLPSRLRSSFTAYDQCTEADQ